MELWGDGKSLHAQVQFYLAGFNTAWSPQCSFSPQVGSVGWPAGGTNAPEFEGGGSTVIGGQRIAYINLNLAAPIPYGASVFLTGACPN